MFRPSLLRTTLLLFGIWACSGFVYLGFVVLTPAVGNGDGAVTGCNPDGTAGWDDADFTAVMATSAAEAPGYIAVIILSDWIGRRWWVLRARARVAGC